MRRISLLLFALASPLSAQFVIYSPQAASTLSDAWTRDIVRDGTRLRMSPNFYCAFVHTEDVSNPTPEVPYHLVVDSVRPAPDVGCAAIGANAVFGLLDGAQFAQSEVQAALNSVLDDSPPQLIVVAVVVAVTQTYGNARPETVGSIRKDVKTPRDTHPSAREPHAATSLPRSLPT